MIIDIIFFFFKYAANNGQCFKNNQTSLTLEHLIPQDNNSPQPESQDNVKS